MMNQRKHCHDDLNFLNRLPHYEAITVVQNVERGESKRNVVTNLLSILETIKTIQLRIIVDLSVL